MRWSVIDIVTLPLRLPCRKNRAHKRMVEFGQSSCYQKEHQYLRRKQTHAMRSGLREIWQGPVFGDRGYPCGRYPPDLHARNAVRQMRKFCFILRSLSSSSFLSCPSCRLRSCTSCNFCLSSMCMIHLSLSCD